MYQSLETISEKIKKLLNSNPRRSLSGIFKRLRKEQKISLIGNYPLLSFILRTAHLNLPQLHWSQNQMVSAIRVTGFYKEEGRKNIYIPKEWRKYLFNN